MASVSFRALEKHFGALRIVKGIDLEIRDGEFVVLVGPSGCGKSTTLRMVAGLEPVSSGEIWIGPRAVNDLPPRARDVAMVFQDYALYPHKSVFENMAFGLRARALPMAEITARIRDASAMLGIDHLLDRMPRALSGGQRQRVAMGRAIVRRPDVFLFDEPLSNLDAKLRGQVRAEIKKLHQAIGTTIIYVTHDQVEAMTLADRIVIMRAGSIEQVGTPDELYGNPASMFVAGFVGSPAMNFLHGKLGGGGITLTDGSVLRLPDARLPNSTSGNIVLGLRPEHVCESEDDATGLSGPSLSGRVEVVEPLGADTLVHLRIGDSTVVCRMPPQIRPLPGSMLRIGVDPARLSFFDPATDARLS